MKKKFHLISGLRKIGRIKTFGNSMLPLLHDGDIVHFKPISFQRLAVDDIVTTERSGSFVTHRVIYKGSNYLITKGDANLQADGKFYEQDIVGRVVKVTRGSANFDPSYYYLIQSTLYFRELMRVFKKFNNLSVNYVILKGLPLYLNLIGSHPRRIYADCDILVNKSSASYVIKILKSLGFVSEDLNKYARLNKYIGLEYKEITFHKNIQGLMVVIDLHFEVTFATHKAKLHYHNLQRAIDRFSMDLLANKQFINIQAQKVPVLMPNNQVLYLLLHLYNHNWQGVHRFEFLRNYINKYKNDICWKIVFRGAQSLGFVNFIVPGVLFLRFLYPSDVLIRTAFIEAKAYISIAVRFMLKTYLRRHNVYHESDGLIMDRLRRAVLTPLLFEDSLADKLMYVLRPSLAMQFLYFSRTLLIDLLRKRRFTGLV